jgi:hypothetical protein
MFWSFTTTLVRTDFNGRVLNKVAVANHHGDLCHAAGKLYVAVNLGRFNDPAETADSWVYVYDAASLEEVGRHPLPEVVYGAGGMDVRDGRYFVVGGLPDGAPENFIYEYDARFRFVRRHALKSGPTRMGIQAAAFAHGRWWLGCYGSPPVLLVADSEFASVERFEFNASLGVAALPDGRMIAASGRCEAGRGCTGRVSLVTPDDDAGLVLVEPDRGVRVPQE